MRDKQRAKERELKGQGRTSYQGKVKDQGQMDHV